MILHKVFHSLAANNGSVSTSAAEEKTAAPNGPPGWAKQLKNQTGLLNWSTE